MVGWLWALIGIFSIIIIALLIKIHILQKATKEIANAFADRLIADTNTLIDISCNDRYMRKLANAINVGLRKLRVQQHRFQQGDTELKNAVTNISHDLRTPLTAICGYLELLEEEEKTAVAERYLTIIRNRAELLTQLTEELFKYSIILSREKNGMRESLAVNDVLAESIAAFYATLKEREIIPHIQISDKKIIRTLDRSALTRVFSNLLHNAVKYSDGDLDITLSDTGEIIFANSASGLNEIEVGKLFDRFYTVEAARKSTGLGLAIARTLMGQMGGTISAQYEGGRLRIFMQFPETSGESGGGLPMGEEP